MTRDELMIFKNIVDMEIDRRKQIEELLNDPAVKKYLKLTSTKPVTLDSENLKEIINSILKITEFNKSNGIYVCTSAYYMDCQINYEDSEFTKRNVAINSEYADYRIYQDIETEKKVQAAKDINNPYFLKTIMADFERDNIVLNPHNIFTDHNGYNEVRTDFFLNAYNYGQAKSKKLLLEKYPRL